MNKACMKHYADGGKPETADEIMARMAAKYGVTSAGPVQRQGIAQPAPVSVQQQPQPKPQTGPGSGIVGILKGRQQQIDDAERKAMGYANGGKIKGPGTSTSDSIAAQVKETGEPIKVANEERIVSKAQDMALEALAKRHGYDSLDQMLEEMTGKPVGPTIKGGIAAASNGARPWWAGTDSADERSGLEMERERRKASNDAGVLTTDPIKSAVQYGVVGRPQAEPSSLVTSPSAVADIRQKNAAIIGASPSSSMPNKPVAPGVTDIAVQPASISSNQPIRTNDLVPGGYMDQGKGIIASRNQGGRLNVSNVETQGIADMGKRIVDGSESAMIDQKNSTYNPAAQLERMQRSRMMSDLTDSTITDPAVRERAALALGISGRPEDNQLKQAQAQGIAAQTESTQMLAGIKKKALAGDPQAMASYRALTGRAADNRFTAHVVGGGVNEMGQAQPQYLGVTGPDGRVQFHKPGQQGQQGFSKADVDAAIKGGADKAKIAERIKSMGGNPADYGL